jgi:hypothetical protein
MISIKEYAARKGLSHANVRHKCQRGSYKTAVKIGRDWLIDENEADVDRRVKTGAYKNWRSREGNENK